MFMRQFNFDNNLSIFVTNVAFNKNKHLQDYIEQYKFCLFLHCIQMMSVVDLRKFRGLTKTLKIILQACNNNLIAPPFSF